MGYVYPCNDQSVSDKFLIQGESPRNRRNRSAVILQFMDCYVTVTTPMVQVRTRRIRMPVPLYTRQGSSLPSTMHVAMLQLVQLLAAGHWHRNLDCRSRYQSHFPIPQDKVCHRHENSISRPHQPDASERFPLSRAGSKSRTRLHGLRHCDLPGTFPGSDLLPDVESIQVP